MAQGEQERLICTRCGRPKKSKKGKMCHPCAMYFVRRSPGMMQKIRNSNVRGWVTSSKAKKAQAQERRMTQTEQEVHVPTEKEVEQFVHADIYGVSREDLEKKQKESAKADDGGSICTICYVKGCRIGPMGRG